MTLSYLRLGIAATFLLAAWTLAGFVSVSLPYLPWMDIVRARFDPGVISLIPNATEVRFGIWSACATSSDGIRACVRPHVGYMINMASSMEDTSFAFIGSSWTRGLVLHPFACAFIFISSILIASLAPPCIRPGFLLGCFSTLLVLIALAIDIAMIVHTRWALKKIKDRNVVVTPSTGFWLHLATFVLLILSNMIAVKKRSDHVVIKTVSMERSKPTISNPFEVSEEHKNES